MRIDSGRSKIEVPKDVRNSKPGNRTSSGENDHNIRTDGLWLGVQKNKRPLLASRTHYKYSIETSRYLVIRSKSVMWSISVKGHDLGKCLTS